MERLNKPLLYTYGIADLFFALMINMEAYYFTAFLTDYAQFSLGATAQILGVTGLIDIAFALVGGVILQKVTLKYGGKYRSWFLIGPPIVAPLIVLQFTKIGSDLTAALIVIFGFISSHLLFNVVVSASGAMVDRLSRFPDERTILSASRAQGMSAAGLIFAGTAPLMIGFFGVYTNKVTGFSATVAVYAFLMILGYWYIYRMTAGRDPYDETAATASGNQSVQSVKEMARLVVKNPPLMLLTLSQAFSSTSLFIITALAVYYFTYVVNRPAFLPVFILANAGARLLGTLIAAWIGIRLGKRNSYWMFLSLAAVVCASGRLLDKSVWLFTCVFCISTMFAAIAASMNTALFADTTVYGEWTTGRNIRAFAMALMNLSIKAGVLIRSAVITIGLVAIGFVANATPTPEVVGGISSIMTLTPAAAYALAAAVFFFGYGMEETQVSRMQAEIAARKVPSDPDRILE